MAKETTYEEIVRNIKNKVYSPIYFLMGEEDYYIDRIADYIMDSVLNETEKEFNQTVLYGADTDIATIINGAKRYPMMSKYQVLVVKELIQKLFNAYWCGPPSGVTQTSSWPRVDHLVSRLPQLTRRPLQQTILYVFLYLLENQQEQ